MYTQCTLKKGNTFTQCWLYPASKVKLGRLVKIDLDDEFWQITSVGKTQDENPELKARTWNNNI